jgi:hypothetical protein
MDLQRTFFKLNMDYDADESVLKEKKGLVQSNLSFADTLGQDELNTVVGYLSKIVRFPKVSTMWAILSKYKIFTCRMNKAQKKFMKLVDVGSDRIDLSLDI